ncbi:MAG: lactonase family protein [Actinomycetota bacterium]
MRHRSIAVAVQFALILVLAGAVSIGGGSAWAGDGDGGGAVYAMTNDASGNEVVVYDRKQNGSLTLVGSVGTGGLGTGAGLGSQGALTLSPNAKWLFAVNAGSNDISQFSVHPDGGLSLVDVESSGGETPVSVTFHSRLLYVLNAGSDSISGFLVNRSGLSPLPGSTRPLSGAGTGGAQVEFSPAGDLLVVTEKATNIIDTYTVGEDGLPSGPQTHPSEGQTPFGFAFRRRHLIVSEAFGGAPGASALSSYFAARSGDLTPISSSVPDGQTAACWVVIAKGRFAYTTNTGSNNISSYTIGRHGELTLLDPMAGVTGGAPTDAALSRGDRFLYALNSMDGTISWFRVRANGSLLGPVSRVGGLPPGSAVGIAAF